MCENGGKSLPRAYPRVSTRLNSFSTELSTGERCGPLRKALVFHKSIPGLLLLLVIMNWVSEVLARCNLKAEYQTQRVLLFWNTTVGQQIAQVSRAERFSNGTLWVAVASPIVSQELLFLEGQYIKRLNAAMGENIIQKIRFVPGQFKKTIPRKQVTLPPFESEEAHRHFSALPDPKLRALFEQLYLTLRKRELALLSADGKRCSHCGVVFVGRGEICPGCRFDRD